MSKLNHKILLAISILTSVFLTGCQTVGETLNLDTDVLLSIEVEANVNPDESNKPSPLFLRFYELQSNKVFENADFVDLYEKDSELLGGDLIAKQELKRVTPGESRKENFVLNKDTRYIAIYAEFFNYNDSKFRVVVPVENNNVFQDKVKIRISGNRMSLVKRH